MALSLRSMSHEQQQKAGGYDHVKRQALLGSFLILHSSSRFPLRRPDCSVLTDMGQPERTCGWKQSPRLAASVPNLKMSTRPGTLSLLVSDTAIRTLT